MVDPEQLAPAEDVGLLRVDDDGRITFTHPLFASAVYSGAPLARRRAVHRALAAELVDPIERAHHLALGCDGPDETVARELELAAAVARSRAAPDAAAELIDLALGLVEPSSASADRLSLELAEHLYLASDFPRARALLEELRTRLPRGEQRSRALFALAEIDYWRSGESAALALVSEALDDADDPIQRARCYAQVATYAGTVELERAVAAADAALELLSGHEDEEPAVAAAALAARVRARLFAGEGFAADEAERAYALEASQQPPAAVDGRIVFRLGQWLRYVDDLEGARERLAEAEGQARDEGDDASLGNILLNQLIVETWSGSWDAAAERTDLMAEAFAQQGVVLEGIAPWRAYLAAHAGRIDEVRRIVGPPPVEPVIAAIRLRCLGLAELAVGELDAADEHLSEALATFDRVGFREPAIWRVDGDAIEAAVGVGAVDRASTLVERFEERAARSGIPWSLAVSSRCRGMVAAALGDLDAATRALDRALDAHRDCPVPFEHARTLLLHGQVLRRRKRKRDARSALEQSRAIFVALDTRVWVERTEAELRRVTVRSAPEGLTSTELRIAQLAAAGLSNPEIATRAFVARKTVEATLARAYRKLGISNRSQLDRALREGGLVP